MSKPLVTLEAVGLEDVADFIRAVAEHHDGENPIYRGHASEDWEVKAAALRDKAAGLTTREQLHRWKALAQRFVSPRPSTNLEYLVLAQHYGIATCLLDWTTNPLVALFFACQPLSGRKSGVVVQARRADFRSIDTIDKKVAIFRRKRDLPLLLDTSASNIRSTAQDSLMSLHTPDDATVQTKTIFTIDTTTKHFIMNALGHFGITTARVYADLGVAAEQFRLGLVGDRDTEVMLQEMGFPPDAPIDNIEDDDGL